MSSFLSQRLREFFLFSAFALTMFPSASGAYGEASGGSERQGGRGFNYGLGLCYEGDIPALMASPSNDMLADYAADYAGVVKMAFGDAWLRRSGKVLELCDVMFGGDAGRGRQATVSQESVPSSSRISERLSDFLETRVVLDSKKRAGVFRIGAVITGRPDGPPRVSGQVNGGGGDWGLDFSDLVGILGPKISMGTGSVLDGDVAFDVASTIKIQSVKAAVLSASLGSCSLSLRNQEIKAGFSSKLPDVFLLYPPKDPNLASAASAWRSELIRQRGFLINLIKTLSISPGVTKQFRDAVDSVALGRFVAFAGGDGCSELDGLETWRASFRFDSENSKKTAFEVSEKVKICTKSPLNSGWKSLPTPSEEDIKSNIMEEEALTAEKGVENRSHKLNKNETSNPLKSTNIGSNFEEFKVSLAGLFFEWAKGKYGTAGGGVKEALSAASSQPPSSGGLIGDLQGKLKGVKILGGLLGGGPGGAEGAGGLEKASDSSVRDLGADSGGPDLFLSFPDVDHMGLFLSDWAPPRWPCPSVPVGGSPAWESSMDASAEAVFCPGAGAAKDGKVGGDEAGQVPSVTAKVAGQGRRVSVLELVSASLERLKVASEMYASFSLVVLKDDVAAGSYKMMSSPSFSCIDKLAEETAVGVRQKIENVRGEVKENKENTYASFERTLREMDSFMFTVFQSEQDRLFFYASKMRDAMLRDDTYRQLDRVRRRENISSESK